MPTPPPPAAQATGGGRPPAETQPQFPIDFFEKVDCITTETRITGDMTGGESTVGPQPNKKV
jgi:hypothetical protein